MIEKSWSNQEIITLFETVAEFRKNKKPLLSAFSAFAKQTGRNAQSIRNFYYAKLKEVESDKNLQNIFHINLDNHKKTKQNFFTKEEYEKSMKQINSLTQKGYSVRKACLEIAGGDLKEMLRLQNKYRSQDNTNNITVMPQKKQSKLSDEEITSLFLGLVKIVKNNAKENASDELFLEIEHANNELRKSIKILAEKEREVKILRKKFEILSNEKMKLNTQLQNLRTQNLELMQLESKPEKMQKLRKYLSTADNLGVRN